MLALSKNIQNIQIYIGSFETLVETYQLREIYYKEHPLNKHYTGQEETRDWIIADISGYYPSFFAYWKKMEKAIKLKFHDHR
jgi:deoxyribodipyrimidine photo-lyase